MLSLLETKTQITNVYLKTLCYTTILPSIFLILVNDKIHFISIIIYLVYILVPGMVDCTTLKLNQLFKDHKFIETAIMEISQQNDNIFTHKIFFYLILAFLGPKIFSNFLIPHFLLLEFFISFDFFDVLEVQTNFKVFLISYFF
ncbi:hypothetical protein TUBRATIS_30170, partial [Tubulinosema ratisbonensis]